MPYEFSLPSPDDLSRGQRIALLAQAEDTFIITGCPGSGKTTVAMMRARNKGSDPKHHYTVWANLLYGYLVNCSGRLGVSERHFSTFFSWYWMRYQTSGFSRSGTDVEGIVSRLDNDSRKYSELQLDEGQDMELEIRCHLSNITDKLVICMDPAQDVKGQCDANTNEITKTINYLQNNLGKRVNHFSLNTNWRNTEAIFHFSQEIVPEIKNQIRVEGFAKPGGKIPKYQLTDGLNESLVEIEKIIKNSPATNIGVFDDSLNNLHRLSEHLTRKGIKNTIYDNKEHSRRKKPEKLRFLKSMENVVLCTFISCKGLEFNTVIFMDISNCSETLKYKKGYYVGATRAKDDLILLASNRYRIPSWFERIPESKNGKTLYRDSNKQIVSPDENDSF
ncbi:MAG: hypothetical protein P8N52_04945 [Crocinitomicaceae bacterium]|nr:hypothetical protein [Crocinitomicaceae bacterium]